MLNCRRSARVSVVAAVWLVSMLALGGVVRAQPAPAFQAPALDFQIAEGRNLNSFVRDADVAAHLLLRSGSSPRIIVAFPAGNSGVGVWFAATDRPVTWQLVGSPRPVHREDRKGRPLRGIEAVVIAHAPALIVSHAVLSSIRVLRDYETSGTAPAQIEAQRSVQGSQVSWERERLDGAPGYRLSIEVMEGARIDADGAIRATARGDDSQVMRLKLVALTGEAPLTPLGGASLLSTTSTDDSRARDVLAFLSYREKLLAGSWRFDTYFGRDTLISLMLLAPVLQPDATESALGSVLSRLSPEGEVAHEGSIGEFAVLENERAGRRSADPIYDYSMVDENFLLAPVAARCLLDEARLRARAAAFLAAPSGTTKRAGETLVRNFIWVVSRTAAFAADPRFNNLIALKEGHAAGNWRDSEEGLGGGRYPYDVNVALVPAALDAIDRLLRSGLLDPYLSNAQRDVLARARAQAKAWNEHSPALFRVAIPADQARARVQEYSRSLGVDAQSALASLSTHALELNALALDAAGRPISVMHSDDGFLLLFGAPPPDAIERAVTSMMRPFPAGLLSSAGLLVANPVFAGEKNWRRFTRSAYHGTVVWSWQQAMLISGIDRQLGRTDLPPALRSQLGAARAKMEGAINGAVQLRASELWSWSYANGRYRAEPFGQRGADVDESNAAQLWSTVFLAIPGLRETPRHLE